MAELFAESLINREPRWPVLLKLTGASLAVHIATLAILFYVPGVREAFNIAAMLASAGYVDKAYDKTDITEDVQMVALADKFRYPPGYFAPDIPNSPAPPVQFPAINLSPRRVEPESTPTPSPEPSPEPSPAPSSSPLASPAPTAPNTAANSSTAADAKDPEEVEQQLNKIATENSVARPNENEINTRPLKDWLARANSLRDKGELDLNSEVEITIAAKLNTDCKLSDAKVIQKSGDARLTDVAKDMVTAIGDSGMLSFLRDPQKLKDSQVLGCDEIPLQLTMKLDKDEISARVESQADSPERAAQMAKGYNGLLTVGQLVKQGRDEEMVYKNTRVTAEGKQIIVSFTMPRQTASEMLKKQLPPSG